MTSIRPVFYVSDGTGITAETIGHTVLTQFAGTRFVTDRIPFVDNVDKARATVAEIRRAGDEHGTRPIVVNSCVDPALTAVLAESGALMLDVFEPFIAPLERELGLQRQSRVGRAHGMVDFETYHRRINAMNYALSHDDGRVTVAWQKNGSSDAPTIVIDWIEEGGPAVMPDASEAQAPAGSIVDRMLQMARGNIMRDWHPDGLRARLRVPLREDAV